MSTKSFVTVFKNASIVTLAGLTLLAGTPTLVQAAPMSLPGATTANSNSAVITERALLERNYAHEQRWLAGQQQALDAEAQLGVKTQAWIDGLKAQGKDTALLDQAMQTFNKQLGNAQRAHNTAAAILNVHAGFNNSGAMIHLVRARATVRTAGVSLESARKIRRNARNDLVRAIARWRINNADASPAPVEVAQPNLADGSDQ